MLESYTPSGTFIHLSHKRWPPLRRSVPSYIRWGLGEWQKLPAILELPDRDKILISEAEEVVKSGKRLLFECGEPGVTHRCHRGRKSQMV